MNTRIFNLIIKNLQDSFNLEKYSKIRDSITKDTRIDFLPWTPARLEKFKKRIGEELSLSFDCSGTIEELVDRLDKEYLARFFGEIWKPTTEKFTYTGWAIVDEVNKHNPKAVLDVGCGYNQFKGRIPNLIGIDPYNNCADYMVDVLDFKMPDQTYDAIICLGSINFNEKSDVEVRLKRVSELLAAGGRAYFRVNSGQLWKNGPYVDIFPWSFEIAAEFSKSLGLTLETFKKDWNDRLYFVYYKQHEQ